MAGTCTMPDCTSRHLAKGLCNRHYHAATRLDWEMTTEHVARLRRVVMEASAA